ncbi:DUF6708 domain-containing protein [Mangrovibacter sp. SLW1]
MIYVPNGRVCPRGTPVRLNRKRQKVYVYEHKRGWPWFPGAPPSKCLTGRMCAAN